MYKNKKHIALLMGGWNSERDVSLKSGEAIYKSLIRLGYKVTKIDVDRNIAKNLIQISPDIVFNALHGRFFEDGSIQGLLDILNIPYTHCSALPAAISMDKILTSKICSIYDIKFPEFTVINKNDNFITQDAALKRIGKPFVIKPFNEGSSIGVRVVLESENFSLGDIDWSFGDKLMVEKYIAGTEIQVAIINDKAIGAIEIRPKKLFYDYECKYTAGMTEYIMPAEIDADKYEEVLYLAKKCYDAIGCESIARVDFILNNKNNGNNQFYFLEINTHPGMTELSLVPKIAQHCGISFDNIIEHLVSNARCKK